MFKLSETSKSIISSTVNLDWKTILVDDMTTLEKELKYKEKDLTRYTKSDSRILGRGSVYVFLDRLMGIKEIDKKLNNI